MKPISAIVLGADQRGANVYRVKQLGDDTCYPIDNTLEYPV